MKKNILFSLLFILNFYSSFGINWEWTKKTTTRDYANPRGIFTDKNGLVYTYGSNRFEYYSPDLISDTTGSYLNCFSSNGDLLYSQHWASSFYITKMSYDKNNSIYFSATFFETHTINGITISSEGDSDGAVGKMDMNGNIIWMSAFGGSGRDKCMGITFNPSEQSVYATGCIKNSLLIDHVSVNTGQQSGIVLKYTKRGLFIKHRRYDFVPERDSWDANCGLEIACNKKGDLFVLMENDGRNWDGPDTITAPTIGRYIMRLTTALDTSWSTYIIGPACYYGYACNSMQVSAAGDVYVSNRCDSKYGGTAALIRLNGNTGNISWQYVNSDGRYFDLVVDSNTVYLTGIEGASICPCPDNNPGYSVIKIIDEYNVVRGELRNTPRGSITINNNNELYVTGVLPAGTEIFGPDTLTSSYSVGTLSKFSATLSVDPLALNNAKTLSNPALSNQPEMNVYPNPAENSFTIECKAEKTCALKMNVYTVTGQTIYSENLDNFSGEYSRLINMESQPKGVYFLSVGFENEWVNKKVIIQ
jgi:type IX secretion system substrate protein